MRRQHGPSVEDAVPRERRHSAAVYDETIRPHHVDDAPVEHGSPTAILSSPSRGARGARGHSGGGNGPFVGGNARRPLRRPLSPPLQALPLARPRCYPYFITWRKRINHDAGALL